MAASRRRFGGNKRRNLERQDLEVLEAVPESLRIQVDQLFQNFLSNSSEMEFSFPPNLTNLERKYIHQKAVVLNLKSRSHGKDPERILTITKKHNKANFESFYVQLCPQSVEELQRFEQTYDASSSTQSYLRLQGKDKTFGKFMFGPPPLVLTPNIKPHFLEFQRQLPIFEMKDHVIETIRNNSVVIVSSETGSGKTTQIPQYILDDCRLRGEPCRVLCTQPRRISAVSVAERVSEERGSFVGNCVGYQVRLETKLSQSSSLIYCTNGILVRNLMAGAGILTAVTHIIIDEVHERDKLSDFLLICLRDCLVNTDSTPPIKLILMSATINTAKLLEYFGGLAVMVQVPGRLFSIRQWFLDEILDLLGYNNTAEQQYYEQVHEALQTSEEAAPTTSTVGNRISPITAHNEYFDEILNNCMMLGAANDQNLCYAHQAWSQLLQCILNENMSVNYQIPSSGVTALMIAVQQQNLDMVEKLCTLGADPKMKNCNGVSALDIALRGSNTEITLVLNMMSATMNITQSDVLDQYYKTISDDEIDYTLVTKLIQYIHLEYKDGAILVFLPGYDDIMICHERLTETLQDQSTYRVFFLHGSMNIRDQHDVFSHLPNQRKIILSTNIAETSLTIDDVVYVIDCGKGKILTYDSCSGLSALQTQWISKACVKQRSGRAGRTCNGMSFHLFSKARYDSLLEERIPEILRVPLEELCLNTKTLARNFPIYDFLVKAPDAPSPNTVRIAIENLVSLGALDEDENLTALGEYLSQITIEPHLGKMLIYASIFKCLDPVLTIVASLAQKDPFQLPPQAHLRSDAAERRKTLSEDTKSDHYVYLKAFMKWQTAVQSKREFQFCRQYFINSSTMETILKTRAQLLRQLKETKFISHRPQLMSDINTHSHNWALVKGILATGLYPKLAYRRGPALGTRSEKKVLIHNFTNESKDCLRMWMIYEELVKVRGGSQIRGVTPVTPITLALLCGIKTTSDTESCLCVDNWLEFEFSNPSMITLRSLIQGIVEKKLACPTNAYTDNDLLVLDTLVRVLAFEETSADMVLPEGVQQRPKFLELNHYLDRRRPDALGQILGDAFINGDTHSSNTPQSVDANYAIDQNYVGHNACTSIQKKPCNNWREEASNPNDGPSMPYDGYRQNNRRYANNERSFQSYRDTGRLHSWKESPGHKYIPPYVVNKKYANNQFGARHYNNNHPTKAPLKFSAPTVTNSNTVFILIKAKKERNMLIAYSTCTWVFSAPTEKRILAMHYDGVEIYLVYVVPEMNTLYGVAKFLSIDRTKGRPTAVISWVFSKQIPYRSVRHLRNSLNNNRLLYDADDGQQLDANIACELWDIFAKTPTDNSRH